MHCHLIFEYDKSKITRNHFSVHLLIRDFNLSINPEMEANLSLSPPCGPAGILHKEWEAHGPEGGSGSSWGPLSHRGHAEQRREGEGGFTSAQWMS